MTKKYEKASFIKHGEWIKWQGNCFQFGKVVVQRGRVFLRDIYGEKDFEIGDPDALIEIVLPMVSVSIMKKGSKVLFNGREQRVLSNRKVNVLTFESGERIFDYTDELELPSVDS